MAKGQRYDPASGRSLGRAGRADLGWRSEHRLCQVVNATNFGDEDESGCRFSMASKLMDAVPLRGNSPRQLSRGCLSWLPDLDSNQDKLIQNQLCYHYTIGQEYTMA